MAATTMQATIKIRGCGKRSFTPATLLQVGDEFLQVLNFLRRDFVRRGVAVASGEKLLALRREYRALRLAAGRRDLHFDRRLVETILGLVGGVFGGESAGNGGQT